MKKFEEEIRENILEILVSNTGSSLYGQSYLNYDAVVELSEGWISPEDHQAEIAKIELQNLKYREEIARMQKALRKKNKSIKELNGAVKKSKARLKECEKLRIEANNEAAMEYSRKCEVVEDRAELKREIDKLKSQLENQQPEIPEFVAEYVRDCERELSYVLEEIYLDTDYLEDHSTRNEREGLIARYWLYNRTVAKEERFYLKNKLTKKFLAVRIGHEVERVKIGDYQEVRNLSLKNKELFKVAFTQQEIDSMETGSYEQIEVEEKA